MEQRAGRLGLVGTFGGYLRQELREPDFGQSLRTEEPNPADFFRGQTAVVHELQGDPDHGVGEHREREDHAGATATLVEVGTAAAHHVDDGQRHERQDRQLEGGVQRHGR